MKNKWILSDVNGRGIHAPITFTCRSVFLCTVITDKDRASRINFSDMKFLGKNDEKYMPIEVLPTQFFYNISPTFLLFSL